jgi:hypothetical protein
VRDDAHGVEELAAEELQAHDPPGRVGREVLLQQQEVVRQPVLRIAQQRLELPVAFHQRDARACAVLLNSREKASAPFSTRTPRISSARMYESAYGTARALPRT